MRQALFTILAAVFIPLSAFAVDGVTLINQSTVMAAGGFPYTISQSGSYKLSGNLDVPANTDGIHISVSNVILDLNGFSIVGSTEFGIGIKLLTGTSGITIRNGNVTGLGSAVVPVDSISAGPVTLQDLYLRGGFGGSFGTFFGPFTRILNVTAPDQSFMMACPSVVTGTTAFSITLATGIGNCNFSLNSTVE
jgi:hypothetical protein